MQTQGARPQSPCSERRCQPRSSAIWQQAAGRSASGALVLTGGMISTFSVAARTGPGPPRKRHQSRLSSVTRGPRARQPRSPAPLRCVPAPHGPPAPASELPDCGPQPGTGSTQTPAWGGRPIGGSGTSPLRGAVPALFSAGRGPAALFWDFLPRPWLLQVSASRGPFWPVNAATARVLKGIRRAGLLAAHCVCNTDY